MKKAALYCAGRIIIGHSHLDAWQQLNENEKSGHITSGFFDSESGEFLSDLAKEHFYNKKICLIRHGCIQFDGSIDPEMSELGYKEVRKMAEQLINIDFEGFIGFTSPLLRCLQTAEIIQEILGLEFTINTDIMENHCNNNSKIQNHKNRFPKFKWLSDQCFDSKCETGDEFITRIGQVLSKLPQKCMLISHCGVVTNMARLALCDEKVNEHNIPTASVTFIDNQEIKCLGRISNEIVC
jgi:broad specificity phosphatase PhoE